MTINEQIQRDLAELAEVCDQHLANSSRILGTRIYEADGAINKVLERTKASAQSLADSAGVDVLERAYHHINRRYPDNLCWTPGEVVPINPRKSKMACFWRALKWMTTATAVGMAARYVMGEEILAMATLPLYAIPYIFFERRAQAAEKRYVEKEQVRTFRLYDDMVYMQTRLGLSDPRQLTPFVVVLMGKRYDKILRERKANEKERERKRAENERIIIEHCIANGELLPDYLRPQTRGRQNESSRGNRSRSYDAAPVTFPPFDTSPAFNIDGNAMVPGTYIDVTGKPYGSM